jgi:CubicO group peptidase (beta-lactamase class C family)
MRKALAISLLFASAAFGQSFAGSAALDAEIEAAIREDSIPGAVLLIGHKGQVIHRKAYGNRAQIPQPEPMTVDTIFDCASLTKVVATTSALMKLFEEGKFRLNDPLTDYLPAFQGGKSPITIRNLLTHFSGLRPDLDLEPAWSGYETGVKLAFAEKSTAPPGARFVYSDINFILLGELVRKLSGEMLNVYAQHAVFEPLGMKDTMFLPPASLRPRIAPTESVPKGAPPLRGVVHDETTRYMGGVAGHAGLFSTADDLARFCEMVLGRGESHGVRVFSPLTIEKFTTPQTPPRPGDSARAGLGYRFALRRQPGASCSPSARLDTPVSRAHPSGLTLPPGLTSSCSPTACIRFAGPPLPDCAGA